VVIRPKRTMMEEEKVKDVLDWPTPEEEHTKVPETCQLLLLMVY